MNFTKEDLDLALAYANEVVIQAEPDPDEEGSIRFFCTPEAPENLSPAIFEILCDCREYYQRAVFLGELELDEIYEEVDKAEAETKEGEVTEKKTAPTDFYFEDLNRNLKKFKSQFVLEVKKSLGLNEQVYANPFAQAMMRFKSENEAKTKKE